jgi:hypothetical protein
MSKSVPFRLRFPPIDGLTVRGDFEAGVSAGFCPARKRQPQGLVDRQLVGLRTGGLAEVVNFTVVTGQHDGDPFLAGELRSQALPAQMNPLGTGESPGHR